MEPSTEHTDTRDREIAISRVIDGPPHLVFEAYSNPEHLGQWWGPNGFTTTTHSFEFRPGGVWEFTMHGPDGTDYPNWICWLEIVPPERIVLRHGASSEDPDAFTSTITIVDVDGRSEVTLHTVFETRAQRDEVVEQYNAIEGGKQTLGRLAAFIAGQLETTPEGGS